MKFSEFNLDERLLQGITKAGFEKCMPVQEATLAQTLEGKDVFVQSQTGSGKTAAFLITILQLQNFPNSTYFGKQALIVAPTRELAVQIEKEAKILSSHLKSKIACLYGGVGYQQQEKELKKNPDIIIGTPGRLIDFGEKRMINFYNISIVVIDEADRLFDMGFLPDLRRMLKKMSPATDRLTMLYSATLNVRVRNLAWEYMEKPHEIAIQPEQITVDAITQELYHVGNRQKISLMLGLLKKYNPENAIIFTNTKQSAFELSKRLEHNGFKCTYITGDLQQKKRLKIIEDTKNGNIKFLIATDVAARGLHIDDLQMVINYDLPLDTESYVHRIGRTARAGKTGKAITLACEKYVYGLEPLEKFIGKKIPTFWPEEDDFQVDKSAGMRFYENQKSHEKKETGKTGHRGVSKHGTRKKSSMNKKTSPPERPVKTRKHTKPLRSKNLQNEIQAKPLMTADAACENNKKNKFFTLESTLRGISVIFKKPQKNSSRTQTFTHRNKGKSLEERLAYYNKKYGEQFKVDPSLLEKDRKKPPRKGIVRRLFGLLNGEKK